MQEKSFVTNFNRKIRYIYARAIATYRQKTGKDILEIRENAYWMNGCLDKKMNALHVKNSIRGEVDLSDFWRIFDSIKEKEINVYIKEC